MTIEEMYRAYWKNLLRYILVVCPKLSRDEAEDAAQETLIKAWLRYDNYDPTKGDVIAWLFGIAYWEGKHIALWNYRHVFVDEGEAEELEDFDVERVAAGRQELMAVLAVPGSEIITVILSEEYGEGRRDRQVMARRVYRFREKIRGTT